MSNRFAQMLNRPLPSKSGSGYYTEGCETEGCSKESCKTEECEETSLLDEDEKGKLTEEEEQNIDERIKRVATPLLIQDELSDDEEVNMFKESVDTDVAMDEGYFTERTIVRFDKRARRSQLKKVAVFAIAKEKNDVLYRKLVTIWKLERKLEAMLCKKYNTQAEAKVKKYIADAKKSKSSIVKKAINKITGKK